VSRPLRFPMTAAGGPLNVEATLAQLTHRAQALVASGLDEVWCIEVDVPDRGQRLALRRLSVGEFVSDAEAWVAPSMSVTPRWASPCGVRRT
jgi:hypothetical protein